MTEIENEETHTHEGDLEVVVPPWLLWSLVGVGVGVVIGLGIDWFLQRRRVASEAVKTTKFYFDGIYPADNQVTFEEPLPSANGSGPVTAKSDESPVL